MSATSGGRRNLMQAGSVAVYQLDALAPDPLATAAALSATPKRSRPDSSAGAGLRSALATSTPPRGRRLLDLIAQSPMAKSLVYSYICAEQRKEPVRVLAQILSPLTAGYSLRIFNECFEFQLGEAGVGPRVRSPFCPDLVSFLPKRFVAYFSVLQIICSHFAVLHRYLLSSYSSFWRILASFLCLVCPYSATNIPSIFCFYCILTYLQNAYSVSFVFASIVVQGIFRSLTYFRRNSITTYYVCIRVHAYSIVAIFLRISTRPHRRTLQLHSLVFARCRY